jgi:hypothetical protein
MHFSNLYKKKKKIQQSFKMHGRTITNTECGSLVALAFTLKRSQWVFGIIMWGPGKCFSVVAVMSLLQMEVGRFRVAAFVKR